VNKSFLRSTIKLFLFCYYKLIHHRIWNLFVKGILQQHLLVITELMLSGCVMNLQMGDQSQWLCNSFHPVLLWQLHTSLCTLSTDQAFIHTVHCNLPVFFVYMIWLLARTSLGWLTYNQWIIGFPVYCFYDVFLQKTVKPVDLYFTSHGALISRCTYAWSNL
jgi:hypothetical protein